MIHYVTRGLKKYSCDAKNLSKAATANKAEQKFMSALPIFPISKNEYANNLLNIETLIRVFTPILVTLLGKMFLYNAFVLAFFRSTIITSFHQSFYDVTCCCNEIGRVS